MAEVVLVVLEVDDVGHAMFSGDLGHGLPGDLARRPAHHRRVFRLEPAVEADHPLRIVGQVLDGEEFEGRRAEGVDIEDPVPAADGDGETLAHQLAGESGDVAGAVAVE